MKTELKSDIFPDKILVKTFLEDFKAQGITEEVTEINGIGGIGTIKEIQISGIRIITRDIKTNYHDVIVKHDYPFFKLQFEIEGSSRFTPFTTNTPEVYIPGGHYNLFYLPKVHGNLSYDTTYRRTLEIVFTKKYIEKIIGSEFTEDLKRFGKAVINQTPFLMWNMARPITAKLQITVQEIVNCNYKGNIKKAFLEAKINELLITLLAKTNEQDYFEVNTRLTKEESEKILALESYIKANLGKSLTIPELAAFIGVNTSKLKKDFKVVFSTTIFKHISKLRMDKARELIAKKGFSIAQASYEVGYKNQQHFTVAFKKIYGFMPSVIKNK